MFESNCPIKKDISWYDVSALSLQLYKGSRIEEHGQNIAIMSSQDKNSACNKMVNLQILIVLFLLAKLFCVEYAVKGKDS